METILKLTATIAQRNTVFIDDFRSHDGRLLAPIRLHYMTWGCLNANADNVVWIVHGLTANADAMQWWSGVVGCQNVISPRDYFIICVNMPGSCYGSALPHEILADLGETDFQPVQLIPRDVAQLFHRMAIKIGIRKVFALVGVSIGGFIALEWALLHGSFVRHLMLVATSYCVSPWNCAINESQLMALENADEHCGLAAARSIAMLSYRTPLVYNQNQSGSNADGTARAASYQRHQGGKMAHRFTTQSYRYLIRFFNAHNVACGQLSDAERLSQIESKVLIIGFLSDMLFPVEEQRKMHQMIPGSVYAELQSIYGHDAFLVEIDAISDIIFQFLKQNKL